MDKLVSDFTTQESRLATLQNCLHVGLDRYMRADVAHVVFRG